MNQADGAASYTTGSDLTSSILVAAQKIEGKLEGALGSVGLSMAKYSALSRLAEAGDQLTLGQLAERLSCGRSNITQLVDRLEGDGLVRRVDDPADRRSVRAQLTPLGADMRAAGAEELAKVQQEMAERLSSHDLESLESALTLFG